MTGDPERDDPHDLARFILAQADVYESALAQIKDGRKAGHWMWFVFPQLRGLGTSTTARFYGLASLGEARAYLAHEVLGSRLRACSSAAAGLKGRTALEVFGHPDDLKLCSSLTLFACADPGEAAFALALDTLCAGRRDTATLRVLEPDRNAT